MLTTIASPLKRTCARNAKRRGGEINLRESGAIAFATTANVLARASEPAPAGPVCAEIGYRVGRCGRSGDPGRPWLTRAENTWPVSAHATRDGRPSAHGAPSRVGSFFIAAEVGGYAGASSSRDHGLQERGVGRNGHVCQTQDFPCCRRLASSLI